MAGIPRSTYYYCIRRFEKPDKYSGIKDLIDKIFEENRRRVGYRRITVELKQQGICINHKTVQRLMKELGLFCKVRMKKYRSYKGEVSKTAPNLLDRNFKAFRPNEKWVTDVTEFSMFGQKLYLSPILDLYNGEIISYSISLRPDFSQVRKMLKLAFEKIPDGTELIPF